MNLAAKELRDMRTAELRRLKGLYPNENIDTLREKIMNEDYIQEDAGCCTDKGKFSDSMIKFRTACEKCDEIEAGDSDG